MDDTENYLNSILQKRIGSVVNASAFTKNGSTVARLPQQQQKVESMPTVFRKKYETVYNNSQAPSYVENRASFVPKESVVEDKEPVGSHRVEYMAISKRIEKKKEGQFVSPTVDVTKYRNTNTVLREKSPIQEQGLITIPKIPEKQEREEREENVERVVSPGKSKRRRIFGPK